LAALNANDFYQKMQVSWLPEMCSKYSLLDNVSKNVQSVSQVCLVYVMFIYKFIIKSNKNYSNNIVFLSTKIKNELNH